MVNLLDFPPELFYEGGADNGYERYMKDDPTGINHVLDEMYGAVFNLEEADFEESDPAFYMDWAYRLAIAIKLQKYPHRFLRMNDVEGFFVDFMDAELCLSAWMAYALLGLRDDNSNDLKTFLAQFWEYLNEEDPYSHTGPIIERLHAIVEQEKDSGRVYNAILCPQLPEVENFKKLYFDKQYLTVKDRDAEYLLLHVVKHDVLLQQTFLDMMKEEGVFEGDYEKLSLRIGKGEFISYDEQCHPELPEASEEEQRIMRTECINEMNLWKQKAAYYKAQCECYEQKEKLTSLIDGAVELGKGIDTHLQGMYETLKKDADEQKNKLGDRIKELEKQLEDTNKELLDLQGQLDGGEGDTQDFSLSPEGFEMLRKNSGGDFTLTLDESSGGIHSQLSNRIPKILAQMWNSIIDPSVISSANYPGAKKMLEIMLDTKEVYEAIDTKDERALSRNLRKVDRVREQNEELYQNQKEIKRMQLASLHSAQNVTIINGNKVERSYGDNYNLEAGAKVEAQASLQQQQQLDGQQKSQWILNNVSSPQTR